MSKKNKSVVSKVNKPNGGIKKDMGICHHCGNERHWRRNCKEYFVNIKANRYNKSFTSCMFIIENYLITLHCSFWLWDTEYGFHICNYIQELMKSRRSVKGKVELQLNNKAEVVAFVVETSCFFLFFLIG